MVDRDDTLETVAATAAEPSRTVQAHRGVFLSEGDFWHVAFDGESFKLKHSKGLSYLSQLLRFPGSDFYAADLAGGIAGVAPNPNETPAIERSSLPHDAEALSSAGFHVGDLGDAGEMLDQHAKAQYRRRLDELRAEFDEAKRLGNIERAERAEAEIDSLRAELSRAVGLGGRSRRAASASERARQSVTHAIKSAIARIAANHSQLGALLLRCIKTGITCAYYPSPAIPIDWEFGASGPQQPASIYPVARVEAPTANTARLDALRPPTTPVDRKSPTQMVGRDAELNQLWRIAQRPLSGHGAIVPVGGGPGVGKTRLSMEFLALASQLGFACFSGRCYERDEPHPLMPFVEIIEAVLAEASSVEQVRGLLAGNAAELAQIAPGLRRVLPDLPTPPELPTAQVRRYLFQSLFDFIARMAQARPLLLVLEDLHWADESTLAMVNFLANRVEHVPLVVVATYRDEELDVTRPLNRTLEELLRLGIHPIKLRGLVREGVAQMLASLSQREPPELLVSLIFEETQGNPFFVEEVFNHLIEEGRIFDESGNFRQNSGVDDLTVPENVRLVLGRRLSRLSENAREILSAASVIGRNFSYVLLEAVLAAPADTLFAGLEEAQRNGFINSNSLDPEASFVFSHELVRQTLLSGISQARQQHLHRKIAEALEKEYGARIDERAAEVAHHLLKSGPFADGGKTSYYLSLAGQSSLRAGALEDARRSLASALAYEQTDAGQQAQTLTNLACAERGLGQWSQAIAHLQDAVGLYATAGDLRSLGRAVFEMVETFIWTGHVEEAAEIAKRGLSHLLSDENTYRTRLLPALGLIYGMRGEYAAAMSAFDEALASPAVTPFRARVLAYRSLCHFYFLQLEDALSHSRRSAALSNPQESPWTHALSLSIAMRSLYHLGKPDQALRIGIQAEPLAKGVGQLAAWSICASIQAWAEFGREPNLAILDQRLRDAVTFQRETGLSFFLAQSLEQMSLVRFFAGEWDSARTLAEEARATELPGAFAGPAAGLLFRLAAYSGDRERVLQLAEQAHSQLPVPGQPNTIGAWSLLMGIVESLAMIGERGRASELYPRVRELLGCGAVTMLFSCQFPETVAGISAGAGGDYNAAERHFEVALRHATDLPHALEEAEVKRFHAMMLLQRSWPGDRERAREMLVQAVASYDRIAMPRHVELARGLLAKAAQ